MNESMAGKLLVASPSLADPNFRRTVVLVLRHDDDGAMGFVLNRPAASAAVEEHLPELAGAAAEPAVVFIGGPVEPAYAFALGRLHENARLDDQLALPGVALVPPGEPLPPAAEAVRVFCGYAGWSAGQLDAELDQSAWFVVAPVAADAFTVAPDNLWRDVLRRQHGPLAMFAYFPETAGLN